MGDDRKLDAGDLLRAGFFDTGDFKPGDAEPEAGSSDEPTEVGPYLIERELARGGMGVVYEGHHRMLRRKVALKLLLAGAAASPEEVERFQREARAVAQLEHPNLVRVYDLVEVDGAWCMAMDLIDGESANDRLRREGPLPTAEAARIAMGMADGLTYAHERGILHRDLKPHNVLLTRDAQVKLADFGLAKVVNLREVSKGRAQPDPETLRSGASLTHDGQLLGTPAYMAPEQARGERVDERADVYGLGATLYALLTGRPPARGETLAAVLRSVIDGGPPPPSSLRDDVDPRLDAACMRCLAKDPAARFADAREVAQALAGCLFEPVPERPRPKVPAARRVSGRPRPPAWRAPLLVAGAFALFVGIFAMQIDWTPVPDREPPQPPAPITSADVEAMFEDARAEHTAELEARIAAFEGEGFFARMTHLQGEWITWSLKDEEKRERWAGGRTALIPVPGPKVRWTEAEEAESVVLRACMTRGPVENPYAIIRLRASRLPDQSDVDPVAAANAFRRHLALHTRFPGQGSTQPGMAAGRPAQRFTYKERKTEFRGALLVVSDHVVVVTLETRAAPTTETLADYERFLRELKLF